MNDKNNANNADNPKAKIKKKKSILRKIIIILLIIIIITTISLFFGVIGVKTGYFHVNTIYKEKKDVPPVVEFFCKLQGKNLYKTCRCEYPIGEHCSWGCFTNDPTK